MYDEDARTAECQDCGTNFTVGDYANNNEKYCARCLAAFDLDMDRCRSGECGGCPRCEGDE